MRISRPNYNCKDELRQAACHMHRLKLKFDLYRQIPEGQLLCGQTWQLKV